MGQNVLNEYINERKVLNLNKRKLTTLMNVNEHTNVKSECM